MLYNLGEKPFLNSVRNIIYLLPESRLCYAPKQGHVFTNQYTDGVQNAKNQIFKAENI